MQIIKQCEEQRTLGEHAEGFICGLLEDGRLEVTYAYPALRGDGNDQEAEGQYIASSCCNKFFSKVDCSLVNSFAEMAK